MGACVYVVLACSMSQAAPPAAAEPAAASSVAARQFSLSALENPEAIFWPAYFWMWNAPLEPQKLRRQLRDMAAHDARGVCVVPMPREFRPDSTGNRMDVDYLSSEFFDRVRVAVEQAAALGMHYWLYDEGGWPSGQAAGRVVAARPELAGQVMRRAADGTWSLARRPARPDMLDPRSTETFISLTHEPYRAAVGSYFGDTIRLVFTDEPAVEVVAPGRQIPWSSELGRLFRERFDYKIEDKFEAFRSAGPGELSKAERQARVDFYDLWSDRFADSYFLPLRDWCRRHGLAQGGHLGGDDETMGSAKYGYGHIMRQLRAMDVPGVDIIWRQVFPGRANHHFAKFASSAAHQNGTALALSESFCVYGNGLTPAQMKWLVDFQYVRGVNILVPGCYPLSTEDHLMPGERPHFGSVDPLWDLLPAWHRYVARLGYILSCGEPVVEAALYLPIRDTWATGTMGPAAEVHDALAQALFERQCDFDVVDDDWLARSNLEGRALTAGAARYQTVVVGPNEWMTPAAAARLESLQRAGGRVIHVASAAEIPRQLAGVPRVVGLTPDAADIRVAVRRWAGGGMAMLFNEGGADFRGLASVDLPGSVAELVPSTGQLHSVDTDRVPDNNAGKRVPIELGPGESVVLVFGGDGTKFRPPTRRVPVESLVLDAGWQAHKLVEHRVGEHDFEVVPIESTSFTDIKLGPWNTAIDADFSGRVAYRRTFAVGESWRGRPLRLKLGRVDFAARVRLDGKLIGEVLWAPWTIELPTIDDSAAHELEIEVANTLANALTADRVSQEWARRSGPGWPGPYHARAAAFERESRGGGLYGPVVLERVAD